ncbi:hypothetical protein MATL_G00199920 [Megalops atlanticus]|uniref:Reelin domain-containing protein n=1 Tax=Megalops atlanticus TaxID=7932 RepID=A0A9D3PLZ5_MEGAT|nr:hypothetical protein MATL_G00199920 [Megalops atlanticus]
MEGCAGLCKGSEDAGRDTVPISMQKSDRLCVALLIGLCVWKSVSGYSNGNDIPASVCATLRVDHFGLMPQDSSPPYTVTANTSTYQPGDTIRVTLSGGSGFRGFLVVAQTVEGGVPVGSFSLPDAAETAVLPCGAEASALTQTRNSLKPNVAAIWTAPASDSLGNIVFRATFIKMLTTSAPFADGEISAATCGRTDICIRSPPGCDPAEKPPCLFALISFRNQSEVQGLIQMRGETPGYIAVGTELEQNKTSTMAAVSVPYPNGSFALLLSQFNGTALTDTSQPGPVKSVGSVSKGVLRCSSSINSTSILTDVTSGTIRALIPGNMRFFIATGTFVEGRLGTPNVTRSVTAELPAGTGSTQSPSEGSTPSRATNTSCQGLMLAASLFFRRLWSPD